MADTGYKDVDDLHIDMDSLDDLPDLNDLGDLDDLPDLGDLDDLPSLEDLEMFADFSDLEADAKAANQQEMKFSDEGAAEDAPMPDMDDMLAGLDAGLPEEETSPDMDGILAGLDAVTLEETSPDMDDMLAGLDAASPEEEMSPDMDGILAGLDAGLPEEETSSDMDDILAGLDATAPEEETSQDMDDILAGLDAAAPEEETSPDMDGILAGLDATFPEEETSSLNIDDLLDGLALEQETPEADVLASEVSSQEKPPEQAQVDSTGDGLPGLDALSDVGIENKEFSPENIDDVLESLDMGVSVPLQTEDEKDAVAEDDLAKLMEEYSGSDAEVGDLDSLLAMMEQEEDSGDELSLDDVAAAQAGTAENILALAEDSAEEGLAVEVPAEAQAKPEKKKGFFAKVFGNVVNEEIAKAEQEAAAKEAEEAERKAEADRVKKEEDKAKKEQALEEKKARQEQKKAEKQAKKEAAKAAKAAKKEARKAEEEAEAALEIQGKLNKVGVSIVAVLAAAFVLLVIFGTRSYGYNSSIKQSDKYFGMKKYTKAYEEIQGVEVKQKDMELYNKIMTVMYVNREIDSYSIFTMMKKYPEALDALIKGLENYDANLETAEDLDIVSDMDYCKAQILESLQEDYGVSEQQARAIMSSTTSEEYSKNILDIVLAAENNSTVR